MKKKLKILQKHLKKIYSFQNKKLFFAAIDIDHVYKNEDKNLHHLFKIKFSLYENGRVGGTTKQNGRGRENNFKKKTL